MDEVLSGEAGLDATASLADPLRRRLYRFVSDAPAPVGKDDAATHVGIGRSLAAYHLDRLVADGLLSVTYARRSGRSGPGAGRPAKLYRRANREVRVQLPVRDDALLARLLAAAVEADDSHRTHTALQRAARAEGEEVARSLANNDPETIAVMLGERGYAPCAESGEIRMRNCPFHHLVDNHRDLVCGLNHALLDAVVRTSRAPLDAALEPHADRCCVVLRPRAVSR